MILSPMTPPTAHSMPPVSGLIHYYDARHGLSTSVWRDLVGNDHLERINDTGNLVIHDNNLQGLGSAAQGAMYAKENCDVPAGIADMTLFAVLEISSYADYTQPFFVGKGYTGNDPRGCRGFTTSNRRLIAADRSLMIEGEIASDTANPPGAFVVAVLTVRDGALNAYSYPSGEQTVDLPLRSLESSHTISIGGRVWAPDQPWHTLKWGNRIYACGVLDRAVDAEEIQALYAWARDTFDNQAVSQEGLIGLWDRQLSAAPNGETATPFPVCNIARAKPNADMSTYSSTIPQDEPSYWKTGPDRATLPRIPLSLMHGRTEAYIEFACDYADDRNGYFGLYSIVRSNNDATLIQTINNGRDLYIAANTFRNMPAKTFPGILTRQFHTWGIHSTPDYLDIYVDGEPVARHDMPQVWDAQVNTVALCVASGTSNMAGRLYTYRLYDRLPDEAARKRNVYVDRVRFQPSA